MSLKSNMIRNIYINTQRLILLAAVSFTAACQSVSAAPEPQAARLVSADDASLYSVRTAIEAVMKRKNIIFGATNWETSSVISVLPVKSVSPNGAPFNQQDFERPTLFNLMMSGPDCYLVQQDTDDKIMLNGVACTPLTAI